MNAMQILAIPTPSALTQLGHTVAPVIQDLLEMAKHVQVNYRHTRNRSKDLNEPKTTKGGHFEPRSKSMKMNGNKIYVSTYIFQYLELNNFLEVTQ